MQHFSFDFGDPVFAVGRWHLSFQVITLENVYGLDPGQTTIEDNGDRWQLHCSQLSWAGQQQRAPGSMQVTAQREAGDRLRIVIKAAAPHKIRAVKILLRRLPPLRYLDMLDTAHDVPADGYLGRYPNPLRLPLLYTQTPDGVHIGLRCADPHARAKRFAVYQERMGRFAGDYAIECIHEEDARWFDTQINVPEWVIDSGVDVNAFRDEQLTFNEQDLGLVRWQDRTDFPAWTRDIHLCLTLHGMHWTGYIFNTYEQMLAAIRFAAERLDGKHILAYLPGWEGRYYWQYGDYRPEPRLGGEVGFARLCDEARALGVHVMPMFGGNCVNAWSPNFHTYGPSSYMQTATRNRFHGNTPDWDTSRAHDTGWQAWLNPGAPAWQRELSRQALALVDRYGFDAVFLDTLEVWTNDPDFNMRDGMRQLYDRLRAGRPDLLVTAEDWWDGMLNIFPIYQHSGMWRNVPEWVGRYARVIGHICEGEASRGSTGVFESGHSPYTRREEAEHLIPTIAFVDGTLDQAQDEIETVIAAARKRLS